MRRWTCALAVMLAPWCVGGTAHAGAIQDCYANATAAYPTMSVSGWLNGSVDETFTSVGPITQWVAEHHTDSTIDLTGNAAGINAVQQAMDCIWEANKITLSSVFINQEFSSFQVKSSSLILRDAQDGTQITSFSFVGLIQSCNTVYDDVLSFADDLSTHEDVNIGVDDFGTFDKAWDANVSNATTWTCVSQIAEPCSGGNDSCGDPEPMPPHTPTCSCRTNGKCHSQGSSLIIAGGDTPSRGPVDPVDVAIRPCDRALPEGGDRAALISRRAA